MKSKWYFQFHGKQKEKFKGTSPIFMWDSFEIPTMMAGDKKKDFDFANWGLPKRKLLQILPALFLVIVFLVLCKTLVTNEDQERLANLGSKLGKVLESRLKGDEWVRSIEIYFETNFSSLWST